MSEREVHPTVDGIRGHKVMTPAEADLARRVAEDTPPITRQQLIDQGLIEPDPEHPNGEKP